MGVPRNPPTEASRVRGGGSLGEEADKRKKQGRRDSPSSAPRPQVGCWVCSHTQRIHFTDGQGGLRPSTSRHRISGTSTVLTSEHYSSRNEVLSSASQNKTLKDPSRKLCWGAF